MNEQNESEKNEPEYESIQVQVGTWQSTRNGAGTIQDTRRTVRFLGAEVASTRQGDTRGTTATLYETPKGYRVHVENWSRWQGEATHEYLACAHGEGCPADEEGRMCRATVLPAAQVSDRYPALAGKAGIAEAVDLDTE